MGKRETGGLTEKKGEGRECFDSERRKREGWHKNWYEGVLEGVV